MGRYHINKKTYLLGILILIAGCKAENKNADRPERFYPDPEIFKSVENTSMIALDTVENYGRLINLMDRIACDEMAPILHFSDTAINYNLLSFIECSQSRTVADYFRRNKIKVENDSIFSAFEGGEITTDFKEILNTIISEPISYKHGGDTLKPALIFFYADQDYPIEKIKENLITIISEFEEVKSIESVDFPFAILFERNKFPPPPPPPPSE